MAAIAPLPPHHRELVTEQWCLSVDLGQAQDPTAIAVLQHRVVKHVRFDGKVFAAGEVVDVRHLQRLPLGFSYPAQVAELQKLLARHPLNSGCTLVADETGVGRPVCDLLNDSGLKPVRVSITTGESFSPNRGGWHVAKSLLISTLDAALHSGSLRVAAELTEAGPLAEELKDLRRKVSAAGRYQFEARVGAHDDIVLALAIGLWTCVGLPKRKPGMSGRAVGKLPPGQEPSPLSGRWTSLRNGPSP
ncbi:hypothetical protein [Reyranella sp.]|uniref:hypothetical protein n=1 Tax=Reyranella sp. TaxID=1929291 RepID=UPI0037845D97